MARPSLFVLALPRSLSSLLYHSVRKSLGLQEPDWTTDGEILNVRRFAFLAEEGTVEGVKYIERNRDGRRFETLRRFLDQVAQAEGFAYKDVIHPFLVAEWLPPKPFRVLYIERPVPDVALAMLQRGWLYPAAAAEPAAEGAQNAHAELERAMVSGLFRARKVLGEAAGARVRYDDLIQDEGPIWDALRSLYDEDVPRPTYLDGEFRRVRDEKLSQRGTPLYQRLEALSREIGGP